MEPVGALVVFVVVFVVLILLLIKGVVKTFQRNAVVAILCVIFLPPVWMIWAFVELFTGQINN